MLVEYLEDGSEDCPLIRIFGTNPDEFIAVTHYFTSLGNSPNISLNLTKQPGFAGVDKLVLSLQSKMRDTGSIDRIGEHSYVWTLPPRAWLEVAELAKTLEIETAVDCCQWISETAAMAGNTSGIKILLSRSSDGSW